MPAIRPDAEPTATARAMAVQADGEFRRYRSRQTGIEILARVADKPFVVFDQGIRSDGEPGWLECHYVEAGGGPSRDGWAMTPEGFERLYEAADEAVA